MLDKKKKRRYTRLGVQQSLISLRLGKGRTKKLKEVVTTQGV